MHTIYGFMNKLTGEIEYVGCTQDVQKRLSVHRTRVKTPSRQEPLYQTLRKNGLDLYMVVGIMTETDRAAARSIESTLIKEWQPKLNVYGR